MAQLIQLIVSIRNREGLRDETGVIRGMGDLLRAGDAISAARLHFAVLPDVREQEPYRRSSMRDRTAVTSVQHRRIRPIGMPENSSVGFVTAAFTTVLGFALIWQTVKPVPLGPVVGFVPLSCIHLADPQERNQRRRCRRRSPAALGLRGRPAVRQQGEAS